eukprot:scaffold2880_cov103-Cylindrotheca_fusiformis.AAC.1
MEKAAWQQRRERVDGNDERVRSLFENVYYVLARQKGYGKALFLVSIDGSATIISNNHPRIVRRGLGVFGVFKVVVARILLSEPSMISFSSTIIRRMLQVLKGYKSGLSLRSLQSQADRY